MSASIIDPREFSPLPKVLFRHERWSKRRVVHVRQPCMVIQLEDWLRANVLKEPSPPPAPDGSRTIDKKIRLTAEIRGKHYHPWQFIPQGATVVFSRLPFTEEQYDVPTWHPQANVSDLDVIRSFHMHQEQEMMYARDFRSQSRIKQDIIKTSNGQDIGVAYRRIKGISSDSLRPVRNADEARRAMIGHDGRLVVVKEDRRRFENVVSRHFKTVGLSTNESKTIVTT